MNRFYMMLSLAIALLVIESLVGAWFSSLGLGISVVVQLMVVVAIPTLIGLALVWANLSWYSHSSSGIRRYYAWGLIVCLIAVALSSMASLLAEFWIVIPATALAGIFILILFRTMWRGT